MADEHKQSREETTQDVITAIEDIKVGIVEMLKDAVVKFLVKDKNALANLFPLVDVSAVASKILLSRCSLA